MRDTMKNINFQILGIDEREGSEVHGIDQIINKIIDRHFPKLREGTPTTADTRSPKNTNRQDQKRKSSQQITVKTLSKKHTSHMKRKTYKNSFSMETLKVKECRAMTSKY